MLAQAGAVPERCGLTPIFAGVRQRDYADLIRGSEYEKELCGYVVCAYALILKAAITLPVGEQVEFVFERQDRHYKKVEFALGEIIKMNLSQLVWSDGRSKIASWQCLEKTAAFFFEPADYFAYALLQAWRDNNSPKAAWCRPILEAFGGEGYGDMLNRDKVRFIIASTLVRTSIGKAIKAQKGVSMRSNGRF